MEDKILDFEKSLNSPDFNLDRDWIIQKNRILIQTNKLFDDDIFKSDSYVFNELSDFIDMSKHDIDIDYHYDSFCLHRHLLDHMYKQMKRSEKNIKRKERSELKSLINKAFCYDITYNIMSFIK